MQKIRKKLTIFIALSAVLLLILLLRIGEKGPWKFIVVGDSRSNSRTQSNGVNTKILSEIAAEIVKHQADFVLVPGDLVYGAADQNSLESQLTTWRDTMGPVYDAGIGVYPVRGNHDTGNLAAWNNVFSGNYALPDNGPAGEGNLTYSVSHKNVFVIAFDQYVRRHRINQKWLDEQLSNNTKPHIITFGHEPAFKVKHISCLDNYPQQRDMFWRSLRNAGCRFYFCGHDHFFNHAVIDEVSQYVVGTAGAPIYKWKGLYGGNNTVYTPIVREHAEQFGYLLVTVNGDNITAQWHPITLKD